MKRYFLIAMLGILTTQFACSGDKNELKWYSFDSAKVEAAKGDKKILVDVYTDWCHWCKKMDKDTYTDAKVIKYLNEKFIVAKLDAEGDEKVTFEGKTYSAPEFVQMIGVEGYPTLLFLEPDGKIITLLSSYLDAAKFMPVAKFIGESKYGKISFEEFQKNYKD